MDKLTKIDAKNDPRKFKIGFSRAERILKEIRRKELL